MSRKDLIFKGKYGRLALIAGCIVLVDQITKAIVLYSMPLYDSIQIVPGFFNITFILNPGGAFGFLAKQDSSLRHFFFLGVTSVAICFIFYLYQKTPRTHPVLATAFALIFGGAIGNLIDRVRFEKVIDFLDFHLGSYHWPAFNVADSAISIGIAIFLFHLVFNRFPE